MIGRSIGYVAAGVLAIVWLVAAVLKSLDPAAFAEQIALHRISPPSWSMPLAYGFIVIESLLAFALATGFRRRFALASSVLLLLFFVAVTAWAWARGNTADCGCFGRLASRSPAVTILEDLGFLALAILGLSAGGAPGGSRHSKLAFAALVPLSAFLPLIGPRLPVDSLVTDLRIGADLSDLAVDNLSRPLDQGTLVLAFLGGDCAECVGVLPSLNAIARSTGGPPVVGLFAGDRTGAQDWIFTNVPEFEVGDAPTSVLRRYFRRLPRMALVQDGIVRQVWNRPPTLEALRAAVALL